MIFWQLFHSHRVYISSKDICLFSTTIWPKWSKILVKLLITMCIWRIITTQVISTFSSSTFVLLSSLNHPDKSVAYVHSMRPFIPHRLNTAVETSSLSTKVPTLSSCSRPLVYSPATTSMKLLFLFPIT